jgi:hypothetical protein
VSAFTIFVGAMMIMIVVILFLILVGLSDISNRADTIAHAAQDLRRKYGP